MMSFSHHDEAWKPEGFRTGHPANAEFLWVTERERTTYTPVGNHYALDDVSYRTNSLGFRCDEFESNGDETLRVIYTGCSNTFGVGLPAEEIWASVIHKKMCERYGPKIPYWNVSEGGRSTEWCARMLHTAVPLLKPDLVIALFPHKGRREAITHDDDGNKISSWLPNFRIPSLDFVDDSLFTLSSEDFQQFEFIRSMVLIQETCRLSGARFLWSTWWPVRDGRYQKVGTDFPESLRDAQMRAYFNHSLFPERARDLLHCSGKTHRVFADAAMTEITPFLDSIAASRA